MASVTETAKYDIICTCCSRTTPSREIKLVCPHCGAPHESCPGSTGTCCVGFKRRRRA